MKKHIELHEKALALLDLLVRAMKRLEDYKDSLQRWDNAGDLDTIRLVNTRSKLQQRVDSYERVVSRLRRSYIAQSNKIWMQVHREFPVEATFTAWGELEALEKQQAPASTVASNEYPGAEIDQLRRTGEPRFNLQEVFDKFLPGRGKEDKIPDIPLIFNSCVPNDGSFVLVPPMDIPIFHDHIEGEPCAPWSTNIHSSFVLHPMAEPPESQFFTVSNTQSNDTTNTNQDNTDAAK